jgi:hypothetical protein
MGTSFWSQTQISQWGVWARVSPRMAGSPTLITLARVPAVQTIVEAGLIAGVLDGLDAIIYFCGMHGIPMRLFFQYIASGALGTKSLDGGVPTALLGVGFHFIVATGAAATYYVLTPAFPMLLRKPLLFGPLFGVGVYLFIYNVVIPMSVAPPQPRASAGKIINLLFTDTLFVGLSIALVLHNRHPSLAGDYA